MRTVETVVLLVTLATVVTAFAGRPDHAFQILADDVFEHGGLAGTIHAAQQRLHGAGPVRPDNGRFVERITK